MVDTKRTSTDLLTNLFQDGQTAGSITENHLRDFIVSMLGPIGSLSISSAAATTPSAPGSPIPYVKAAGTTVLNALVRDVDMPVSNRLRYTGAVMRHCHFNASVSMTSAGNNQNVVLGFAKNGIILPDSVIERKIGTGADIGAMAVTGDTVMVTNDYVEMFLANLTSTSTVTLNRMNMFLFGLFV